MAVISVQGAMLLWTATTPLGPLGAWMPPAPATLPAGVQSALLAKVDPFNRAAGAAQPSAAAAVQVTEYTLFGTRASAGGLPGAAILSGSDGQQVSVLVGEEVAPGVRLIEVGFDHAILDRGGQRLRVSMEEEPTAGTAPGAAPPVSAGPSGAATPAPVSGAGGISPRQLKDNVAFAPRTSEGRVTGLLVSSLGDERVMQAAGLRNGDVIVAVNGRRITSAADAAAIQAQVGPGARLSLTVERGAATVPVALNLAGT